MTDETAVVIGAGVIGSSIAFALASDGVPVTIVDRAPGPGMGSTSASSAIVRFHYSTFEGVALSWEAKHVWEDWTRHLGITDDAGTARYIQTGALVLDTPGYDSARVLELYEQVGIPFERMTADQIGERFPYLNAARFFPPRLPSDDRFWDEPTGELGGFYTPEGGFVDDPSLAAHNLWAAATARGANSVFRSEVAQIRRSGTTVAGVTLTDGRALDASIVINAAGPHSHAINTLAGVLDEFAVSTGPMRQEVHSVDGPPEPGGALGPAVGDGDLGTYFRFAPGGSLLVGSQEPDCDELEWLGDADDYVQGPTSSGYERQTLRLARRMPSLTIPHRPRGVAGVYDVSDDWIPIYDKTSLHGYYVAIGTSGNQFKNAPVVGPLMAALIAGDRDSDHDASPVVWTAPRTGNPIGIGHYSRLRSPNTASSNSVLG